MKDDAERLRRAQALSQAGQLAEARVLCTHVLSRGQRNFDALQLLGQIALQAGDYRDASQCLAAALVIEPTHAIVNSNLAVALLALGRPSEALGCCDTALRANARYAEALCNRGHALVALQRLDEALDSYQRCVALQPRNVDAWCRLGSVLMTRKRPQEALVAFEQAIAGAPELAEAHSNRGAALRELRRPAEALAAYERAARLRPNFAEVWCNAANLSLDAGRYEEAIGRCDQALKIRPQLPEALNIRGTALRLLKRFAEAAATYETILAREPAYGQAESHLLSCRASLADWTDRDELAQRIIQRVEAGVSASAPHAFLWICDSPATQLACACRYSADQFPAGAPLWQGTMYRRDRLRIAYLSADFADHPVAHLIAGVLERHDRSRFETFGIALARDPAASAMQSRMRQAFEHFHDVTDLTDLEAALKLRELEIDVAVDLTGHTRGGRLGILARRPAPLQVSFLGFAGTSGASYVDYLIGDSVVTPVAAAPNYSEHLIRMPHSFLPNDDSQAVADSAPSRAELGLPKEGFVFCAFNTIYKLNPALFDVWMRLLAATPGSVLWLRSGDPTVVTHLSREAQRRGVDAGRLVFAPRVERMDAHLARYRQADLFLDTAPYGAHATAHDALWAGLPVLTLAGESFASRVAASLLSGLGLSELVTATLDAYEALARRLATSPADLAALRERLNRLEDIPAVFDTDLFRRHLELAYETIVRRQRGGEAPLALDVASLLTERR